MRSELSYRVLKVFFFFTTGMLPIANASQVVCRSFPVASPRVNMHEAS